MSLFRSSQVWVNGGRGTTRENKDTLDDPSCSDSLPYQIQSEHVGSSIFKAWLLPSMMFKQTHMGSDFPF